MSGILKPEASRDATKDRLRGGGGASGVRTYVLICLPRRRKQINVQRYRAGEELHEDEMRQVLVWTTYVYMFSIYYVV